MDSSNKKQTNGATGTGSSSSREDAIINTRNDDDGSSSGGRSKGGSSVSTLSLSEGAGHGVAFEGEDVERHGRNHRHHSADPAGQGNNIDRRAQHTAGDGSSIATTDESDDDRLRRDRPGQSSSTSVNSRGHEYRVGEETRLEEGTRTPSSVGDGRKKSAEKWGTAVSVDKESDTGGGAKDRRKSGDAGGFLGMLRTMVFGSRDPESDLNVEMLEELHMITGCIGFPCFREPLQCAPVAVTSKELRLTRSHFLALVKDSNRITREEFLAIPSVANNPLRERLLVCFGFDSMESLEFKEFVEILSIFNNHGAQRDQKLRMAFTLVDIDGDGQVSKNDLIRYLELITAAPEGVKLDLDAVAARVIEEGVSTPGSKSLSLADYIKIMGAADFDDKLTIPI